MCGGGGGGRETIIIVVPNTTLAVITRMTLALRWAALQTSEWFINGRGVVDGGALGVTKSINDNFQTERASASRIEQRSFRLPA